MAESPRLQQQSPNPAAQHQGRSGWAPSLALSTGSMRKSLKRYHCWCVTPCGERHRRCIRAPQANAVTPLPATGEGCDQVGTPFLPGTLWGNPCWPGW